MVRVGARVSVSKVDRTQVFGTARVSQRCGYPRPYHNRNRKHRQHKHQSNYVHFSPLPPPRAHNTRLRHGQGLGDDVALRLARAIRPNVTLKKLHLHFNFFGDEGLTTICESLATKANITDLQLVPWPGLCLFMSCACWRPGCCPIASRE